MTTQPRSVFISYASADRELAAVMVQALESIKLQVWWDRDLEPGEIYPRKIQEALEQADVAVVLWTPRSVASNWVLAEAELARSKNKLVPVLTERTDIPLPFNVMETVDFTTWRGDADATSFKRLAQRLGASVTVPAKMLSRAWPRIALTWLILPTILAVLLTIALLKWRVPAAVDIDVTASRVYLHLKGPSRQVLLDAAPQSLSLQGFDQVRLASADAAVPGTTKPFLSAQPMVLKPAGRYPALHLLPPSGTSAFPLGLATQDSDVTIEAVQEGNLQLGLSGSARGLTVTVPDQFQMVCDYAALSEKPWPQPGASIKLQVRVPEDNRLVEVDSSTTGITFDLGFLPTQPPTLAPGGINIDRIEFFKRDDAGPIRTTLAGKGTIHYTSPAGLTAVPLETSDILAIGELRDFRVQTLAVGEGGRTLRLRLTGTAGILASGPPPNPVDRRTVQFEVLRRNYVFTSLLLVLGWIIPVLIGTRKLWQGKE